LKTIFEIGKQLREKITAQYPALDKPEIPANYTVIPIEYKKTAIEDYHIIFWHRLLRSLYYIPTAVQNNPNA